MSDKISTSYPDRYYAHYDNTGSDPYPILGWYDTWEMGNPTMIPPIDTLFPLTKEQWLDHVNNPQTSQAIHNNTIVVYSPPVTEQSFKAQAKTALTYARKYVSDTFLSLGETPTQQWIDYQKELLNIINGNSTSTTLPESPVT